MPYLSSDNRIGERGIDPIQNKLIATLASRERDALLRDARLVSLHRGEVLYEHGARVRQIYFPVTSFVSLRTSLEDLKTIGVSVVGAEGVCGHMLVLGNDVSCVSATVRHGGTAWRISTGDLRRCMDRFAGLRNVLRSYLFVTMEQAFRTIACTKFHITELRLARWLLMIADRMGSDTLEVTQECLSEMLGVRRVGITVAAAALKRRQLVRYSRGSVRILDRPGLESAACTCYRDDLELYRRSMSKHLA